MRKLMTMLAVAILSFGVVSAQTRVVSGRVTDSNGDAVPYATHKLKMQKKHWLQIKMELLALK